MVSENSMNHHLHTEGTCWSYKTTITCKYWSKKTFHKLAKQPKVTLGDKERAAMMWCRGANRTENIQQFLLQDSWCKQLNISVADASQKDQQDWPVVSWIPVCFLVLGTCEVTRRGACPMDRIQGHLQNFKVWDEIKTVSSASKLHKNISYQLRSDIHHQEDTDKAWFLSILTF